MGASLYRLHVPSAFGGKTGFDMDISHVLPLSVLVSITFVGYGAGDGGARTGAGCLVELPLCSVAITALLEVGSDTKLLEKKL